MRHVLVDDQQAVLRSGERMYLLWSCQIERRRPPGAGGMCRAGPAKGRATVAAAGGTLLTGSRAASPRRAVRRRGRCGKIARPASTDPGNASSSPPASHAAAR